MSEKWRRSVVAVGCAATLVANRSIRRPRLARSDVGGWGATRWQLARRSRAPLFFHWRSILYAKPQGNIPPLFLASPPPSPLLPIPQCKTFLWLLMGWNRFYWDLLSSLWFFSEPEFYWVRIGSTVLLWTGGVVDALRNFLERRDSSALYLGLASAPRNDIKLPRPLLPHPLPWSFLRNKKKMVRSPIHRPIITHRFKSSGAEKSNLKCFFLTAMTLCSLCLRNEDCFPYFLFKSFDSQFLLSHL